MTREMKDELLLVMLFLGLRRLLASFTATGVRRLLPSPKAGAAAAEVGDTRGTSLEAARPSVLLRRPSVVECSLLSLGCSWMLERRPLEAMLFRAQPVERAAGGARESMLMMDSLVPMVAGCGFVASGFGLTTGASEGCGGGVARWRSSLRT